jgi:hypothetical protein
LTFSFFCFFNLIAKQFGSSFEIWGDGKPDSVGKLLKAPLDDEEDILFVPDDLEKDIAVISELVQQLFDQGA